MLIFKQNILCQPNELDPSAEKFVNVSLDTVEPSFDLPVAKEFNYKGYIEERWLIYWRKSNIGPSLLVLQRLTYD